MPRPALIDRRSFAKAAGAIFLASLSPRALCALERSDAVYASGFRAEDGRFGIGLLAEDGTFIDRIALPDRIHGLGHSAASGLSVAFARRPGTFAVIFDTRGRQEPLIIAAPDNRHFFGHGQFSPDGRLLYASENDFDGNRGMIGIYDANDRFRRIGEVEAHGIGTHDMTVSDDGRFLIIANGGIETHPDFGRTKLNLDHMEPSLVIADAASGALIEKHSMPRDLSRLSTRHLDIAADGRIWFAAQYEGARTDKPPLVGHFAPGEDLTFIALPEEVTEGLANYVGAIAVNRRDGLVGVTSPKGGMAVTLDARSGKVVDLRRVTDAAGIAAAPSGFAVSSYDGRFADTRSPVAWDQHILRIS